MSLILDALKKSEAERQLGRAPGLTTPMPLRRSETGQRPRAWVRYALWLAAVAAAAAGATWLTRSTPAPADGSRREVQATPPPAVPSSTEPDRDARRAADAVAAVAEPPAVPPSGAAPDADAGTPTAPADSAPRVVEAIASPPRDPEFESVERETQPVAPVAASAPPALPAASARPPAPPPMPVPAATPVAEAATASPAAAPPPEALPRLDQLGGPQRDALPPLKQTMHVYAESPAGRFVLIDGHRYREGDQISNSLRLLEIRRDGTVLQYDGLRFLLPRP